MNLNKEELQYWLSPKEVIFSDFADFTLDRKNLQKRRIFFNNQSDILFIAHLDTVLPPKFYKKNKKRIYAAGLDDRLGCLTAFNLSTELKTDLLLTDLEESAKTTARFHDYKDYNWIVEFDRAGKDVVTYDMDSVEFRDALKAYWKIGWGSFSDITSLIDIDTCCMNLGLGTKKSHSKDSFVCLKTFKKQIALFKQFYEQYKNTAFKQDYNTRFKYQQYGFGRKYDEKIYHKEDWRDYYNLDVPDDNYLVCEICGEIGAQMVFGREICESCFDFMLRAAYVC